MSVWVQCNHRVTCCSVGERSGIQSAVEYPGLLFVGYPPNRRWISITYMANRLTRRKRMEKKIQILFWVKQRMWRVLCPLSNFPWDSCTLSEGQGKSRYWTRFKLSNINAHLSNGGNSEHWPNPGQSDWPPSRWNEPSPGFVPATDLPPPFRIPSRTCRTQEKIPVLLDRTFPLQPVGSDYSQSKCGNVGLELYPWFLIFQERI